ncbi:hypothetical protein GDO81_004538 [Engystomops pustulosus]|uniref:Uncharacterized protein n=1 Tax=Engystomops pustulosus TaxID=76066 RepID=A0AAV7A0H8_ENGPU|nr:hypothetical protein GDO81_004538 [Engystomops pustulosus]
MRESRICSIEAHKSPAPVDLNASPTPFFLRRACAAGDTPSLCPCRSHSAGWTPPPPLPARPRHCKAPLRQLRETGRLQPGL